ncbi:HAMP domain-containing histidine kinase [Chitinophaga ginsengisegetis]|uniref:sensor histidine kinase n=1 Tax=Chitinophaga ginsengisegetis TaxID=393003 RepID=UPI0034148393
MIRRISYSYYQRILSATLLALALLCAAPRIAAQSPQLPELLHELAAPHDSIAYINTLGKLGALYMMINLDSSFTYAIREYEIAERWQYKKGMADAFDVMSFCYALRTDFNVAGIYGYKALQLHKAASDSARIAKTLSNLYLYYRNMGRPADANNYFYEAFHMAARLPASQDSIYTILLVNYAMRFYKDSTRKDSVRWALRTAAHISEKYPHSRLPLYIDAYAADTLVIQGRGKEAEARINELAAAALNRGLPYVAMDIYNRLEDYSRLGHHTDSTRYRELSYQLAKKAGCIELNLPVLAGLYDYYQQHNQVAKTDYYSREIMRLAAQHRYQQGKDPINYIAFFLKEQSLQRLSRSNQQQQQELEQVQLRRKHSQFIIAGLFIIVILLFILLYSRYRQYITWQEQEQAISDSYTHVSLKNVALRANDEFKNKLITLIANDFRAPLHHISEVALKLRNQAASQATMAALIREIALVSGNTLCVFDNILKWIRMQLPGFTYQGTRCLLDDIFLQVLKQTAPDVKEKALVVVNLLPEGCVVMADPEMLRVAQLHLMRLSIQYARPGSLLILSAWNNEGAVYARIIADAGPATEDILRHLSSWQHDMHALSYAITRDFMDKMKGAVQATTSEGRYLVFTVVLEGAENTNG